MIENSGVSASPAETQLMMGLPLARRLEYWGVIGALKMLGLMPHRIARSACAVMAVLSYWLWPRLRRVGLANLRFAFPERTESERRRALFGLFRNFGRMLADFAHFPHWN